MIVVNKLFILVVRSDVAVDLMELLKSIFVFVRIVFEMHNVMGIWMELTADSTSIV